MTRPYAAAVLLGLLATRAALGDGPADNSAANVRRVPKLGITPSDADKTLLRNGVTSLKGAIAQLPNRNDPAVRALLPDVEVLVKAVDDALTYQEFFAENEVGKAKELLALAWKRLEELDKGNPAWPKETGLVVRGYVSKIDGSVQPYGLVVPETYAPKGPDRVRLDVWFHGRGENLSEVNFLDERRKRVGEFSPPGTIVLHPYGRYCNAFKFAGEVDVFEAIEAVKTHYRIDPDRVSVRGFSMGGAAAWQFAVHDASSWFAANPGAGFAETPRFLNVFQRETLQPTWYEKALWNLYDCDKVAVNLAQCPTVAYSGELDGQKQAADVMAEALGREGIELTHVIGPGTRHAYHPDARREVNARLASLAESGRDRVPGRVRFATYTLKYNTMNWVTVDALGEHWKPARVDARVDREGTFAVETENVRGLTLSFPPGQAPFDLDDTAAITIDKTKLEAKRVLSDRSWSLSLTRKDGGWVVGAPSGPGLRKRHGLQGPIDDAFMDAFVIVRPTGKSPHPAFQDWCDKELDRAVEHWRRHFRGQARVKNDTEIKDADVASMNLVLWGDPESNAVLKKLADKLPIAWTADGIKAGDATYPADAHALACVYPNPLNPNRYVVLNSGFTFREYDYLNNARQVPKLPDWAVIDLRTPPDARSPGKVVAADFFGESWELRPPHATP